MRKPAPMFILAALVGALVATPLVVYASHVFNDVPSTNTFHEDIAWMADVGVTRGCNPPANDEFCPKDGVTREQMAAFMRRFAENLTPVAASASAESAADWSATSNVNSKELSAVIELQRHGTLVVSGGVHFDSTAFDANCWLTWDPEPDQALTGGILDGTDRVFHPQHQDDISCQTSGAVELEAGRYRVGLLVNGGPNAVPTDGSLQVVAIPDH